MLEIWILSLCWEDPIEEGMATHSSILAWRILWTKVPCGLQSTELQRIGRVWVPAQSHGTCSVYCVGWHVSSRLGLPLAMWLNRAICPIPHSRHSLNPFCVSLGFLVPSLCQQVTCSHVTASQAWAHQQEDVQGWMQTSHRGHSAMSPWTDSFSVGVCLLLSG